MEWAQHGIRVNSVSPGLVNTAMTYWVPQQPDWEQQLKYYGGFPRLAEVQELGGAYVYLLSDAASYTTSIDIPVNGVIGSKFLQRYHVIIWILNLVQFVKSRNKRFFFSFFFQVNRQINYLRQNANVNILSLAHIREFRDESSWRVTTTFFTDTPCD